MERSPVRADLPNWPALMTAEVGGAYICQSESTFRHLMVRHGVRPRNIGNSSVVWSKADVDTVLGRLPPKELKTADSPPPDSVMPVSQVDAGQLALDSYRIGRSERRRAG